MKKTANTRISEHPFCSLFCWLGKLQIWNPNSFAFAVTFFSMAGRILNYLLYGQELSKNRLTTSPYSTATGCLFDRTVRTIRRKAMCTWDMSVKCKACRWSVATFKGKATSAEKQVAFEAKPMDRLSLGRRQESSVVASDKRARLLSEGKWT